MPSPRSPALPSPRARKRSAPRFTRTARPRGLDIAGGKVAGVITERGDHIRTQTVLLAGGAWSSLLLPSPRCAAGAGQRALDLVRHGGGARDHRRRPVDARRHDPSPARWRLHGRAWADAAYVELVAAGPALRPPVLADLQEAPRAPFTFGIGRSLFEGPEALRQLVVQQDLAIRSAGVRFDPAADPVAGAARRR